MAHGGWLACESLPWLLIRAKSLLVSYYSEVIQADLVLSSRPSRALPVTTGTTEPWLLIHAKS